MEAPAHAEVRTLNVDSATCSSTDGIVTQSPAPSPASHSEAYAKGQLLPMDMKAPGETVDVLSRCSSSYSTWLEANPIMYNVRLASANQASGAALSTESHTAHVAAVDLAAHSSYFNTLFQNFDSVFQDCEKQNLQRLMVGIECEQAHLHAIAGALYSCRLRIEAAQVEFLLRVGDYLQMPCISEACVDYIIRHCVSLAPVQVYHLGKDLNIATLVKHAEAHVVQANWEADNLNHLRSLLEGRSAEEVRKLLSHPDRSAVSELEVVEVLRRLSHRDSLAEAINFQRLASEEVAALGRVVRSLPREERSDGFWIDVSDQVIHLQQNPNSEDRTPGLLLWPVEESLLIEPHPHGNRIDSGFVEVNGAKYQGSIVYDSLGDAGLFCYPEPMHSLVEFGRKALVTVFVLAQSARYPLLLKKRLWTPGDTMGVGGGFGQPHCKGHLVNELSLKDVTATGTGKHHKDQSRKIVIGLHIKHQKLEDNPAQDFEQINHS
ncbi:hypothetical protein WJX73_006909 [Symbiochloris irregularis]|uniref:BTB domain-containing protein n=1 Tax=Symbiochloris irregularis TaxID=706552 RepID=A0AAW1P1A7_9CHLO